jgi:hypothetical protein
VCCFGWVWPGGADDNDQAVHRIPKCFTPAAGAFYWQPSPVKVQLSGTHFQAPHLSVKMTVG